MHLCHFTAYEESLPAVQAEETDGISTNVMPESDLYDFKDYGDTYDDERTKRSLGKVLNNLFILTCLYMFTWGPMA